MSGNAKQRRKANRRMLTGRREYEKIVGRSVNWSDDDQGPRFGPGEYDHISVIQTGKIYRVDMEASARSGRRQFPKVKLTGVFYPGYPTTYQVQIKDSETLRTENMYMAAYAQAYQLPGKVEVK